MVDGEIIRRALFLLCFSFTMSKGAFIQKWIIPDGHGAYGRVIVDEINRNALTDMVIKRSTSTSDPKILFYEHQNTDNWELME